MQTFANTVLTLATVFALFGDDLRGAVFDIGADTFFWTVYLVLFVFFSIEIGLSCYCRQDYPFRFYFWLDMVSTASLLLDNGWIVSLSITLMHHITVVKPTYLLNLVNNSFM
jgi:hypothetical protein